MLVRRLHDKFEDLVENLIDQCDDLLEAALKEFDLKLSAAGLFVAQVDKLVWRGLAISPVLARGELVLSPALGFYCPEAYKITETIFEAMQFPDYKTGALSQRMGIAMISEPLHKLVNTTAALQRSSRSYNVVGKKQLEGSVDLILSDFKVVGDNFFRLVRNIQDLIDFMWSNPGPPNPNTPINLMALTYIISQKSKVDRQTSLQRLENIRSSYRSELYDKFHHHLQRLLLSDQSEQG